MWYKYSSFRASAHTSDSGLAFSAKSTLNSSALRFVLEASRNTTTRSLISFLFSLMPSNRSLSFTLSGLLSCDCAAGISSIVEIGVLQALELSCCAIGSAKLKLLVANVRFVSYVGLMR